MNRFIIIAITALFLAICCSCSGQIEDIENSIILKNSGIDNKISEVEAIYIADKVLNNNSRSLGLRHSNINYVLSNNLTRSGNDTLAYIINYENEGGFAIISSTRNVYPVLAFSKSGSFDLNNIIAKESFIDKIEDYYDSQTDSNISYTVSDNVLEGCYGTEPVVSFLMHQWYPWNKFVTKEHKGRPAGCVAVATALVMNNSKYEINYHGTKYYLKSYSNAISKKQNETSINSVRRRITGPGVPIVPPCSYEEAVDSMAKLLYLIGKDLNMEYTSEGSYAESKDAYELLLKLGFEIPSGYKAYDILSIANYIKNNHIVYMMGIVPNKPIGHAWVCDACSYCVDENNNIKPSLIYLHCDWGWGGNSNGYFSGDIFKPSGNYSYIPTSYFAVKREFN